VRLAALLPFPIPQFPFTVSKVEAIVLAGGLGTRLRSVVPDLPKPMAPVNGRPFIEYQLDYWIREGITRFVLSVGYKHETVIDHFGPSYRGVELAYAIEDRPLGTGGGLLLACGHLSEGGPFLALNGDTYFEVHLAALQDVHTAHRADITIALFRSPQRGRYMGIRCGPDGEILDLKMAAGEPGGLANGGVYLVERSVIEGGPWRPDSRSSLEDDILPDLLRRGKRLLGMECAGRFVDIGVPEDYAKAAALLAASDR
jgi:D-glycero-alpha-D-manno-heptose 1-phosphate guanylyltransferase